MRRTSRSIVALLAALLLMNPALACRRCGWSGPAYYGYPSYGYPDYGYVSYSSTYGSCCGSVVVDDCGGNCGGCGACGYDDCGCGPCDGCSGCGADQEVMYDEPSVEMHGETEPHMRAPEPPVYTPPTTTNKPEAAPSLPSESTYAPPPSEPATDRYSTPEPSRVPSEEPPADLTPSDSMPVPPPSEEPVQAPADDLFSAPAPSATPVPETPPAAEGSAPADDLFGPSEPAPESTPAPEATDEAPVDDFFGPLPTEEPAVPSNEEAPAAEEDDLFSDAGSILRLPGGLESHELRRWTDNTGTYTCQARMINMVDGKVRLLKDNGRTSTVPLTRLSKLDLEFVNRQASAKHSQALGQTVQASFGR